MSTPTVPTTIDDFALILGYPRTPVLNLGVALGLQNIAPDGTVLIPANRITRCQELYASILAYESQLEQARANSMAEALGSLRLNYSTHINELVISGHNKLEELAAILNIPIYFDRFLGTYPQPSSFYSAYGRDPHRSANLYSQKTLV